MADKIKHKNWIILGSLCAVGWIDVVVREIDRRWKIIEKGVIDYWQPPANEGANAVRVHWFAVNPDDVLDNSITPWLWDQVQKGWDLLKPDPEYYAMVLSGLCKIANALNLTFWFCLTDQCGQKYPDYTPMKRNVQGFGLKSGLFDSRVWPAVREHVRRSLAVLPLSEHFEDGRPKVVIECGNEIFGNGASEMVKFCIAPQLAALKLPGDQISIGAFTISRKWDDAKQEYKPADQEFVQLNLISIVLGKAYEEKWGEAWGTAVRRLAYRPTHSWLESPKFKNRPFGEQHELHCYEYSAGGRQCQALISLDGTQMDENDPHGSSDDRMVDDGKPHNIRPKPEWIEVGADDLYKRFSKDAIYMQPFGNGIIPANTFCRTHFEYFPAGWDVKIHCAGVRALAQAYERKWGVPPPNKGNVPKIEPPDEPPDKDKPEVKPPLNWRGEWNNNKKIILSVIGGIVVLSLIALMAC